jgi:hypothetical protein
MLRATPDMLEASKKIEIENRREQLAGADAPGAVSASICPWVKSRLSIRNP